MTIVAALLTSTVIVLLLGSLAVSVWYNYKFARIIMGVEDSIESCLDILDERYGALSKIAATEIFFDSPEVRNAVQEISASRDAVLWVANSLASIDIESISPDDQEE